MEEFYRYSDELNWFPFAISTCQLLKCQTLFSVIF